MGHLASVVLHSPEVFDPAAVDQRISGARLATGNLLTGIVRHPGVSALEIFTSADVLEDREALEKAAHAALPQELRGQNRLRFYPLHFVPEVWADGKRRVHFCPAPESMAQVRYLRDLFGRGPQPITCDTHSYSHYIQVLPIAHYAQASPVAYDSIVSLSQSCRETTQRMLADYSGREDGRTAARMDVIPRGIHPEQFHRVDDATKLAYRRKLGLPEEGTIALFLGRVSPYAKADLIPLLRCFAKVLEQPDRTLLIAGEEDPDGYGEHLLRQAAELGLEGRVIVHGRVEPAERIVHYGSADIFVFPGDTIIETFGSTVIEAMACGLPCIVSDWDGLRDSVVDGVTGYKIKTAWMPAHERLSALSPFTTDRLESLYIGQTVLIDMDAFAQALRELFEKPHLREAMGRAGSERVAQHYTWSAVLDSWIALWDELAELAAQETPAQRQERVADMEALGLPNAYFRHFSHYASAVVDPATNCVRLTQSGIRHVQQSRNIYFYDSCLPLIKPKLLSTLIESVKDSGSDWIRIKDLTDALVKATGSREDDIRFHMALLIKRDILELK